MKLSSYSIAKAAALIGAVCILPAVDGFQSAFNHPSTHSLAFYNKNSHTPRSAAAAAEYLLKGVTPLRLSSSSSSGGAGDDKDNEIQRLKEMAAKLRAEAAQLEAKQAEVVAEATKKAFDSFDTDNDGRITFSELKEGLEKRLKTELSERRVRKLLESLDESGDGALQPDEFMSIERMRNRLDQIARDEKTVAIEAKKKAQMEEEALKFLQAQMDILNEGEPTSTEKVLSVLPYLFPLLDSIQFAAFFLMKDPENPLFQVIALLYLAYRSIPFGGFVAFFALSTLSGNPTLNRLIRYNMQQAIYLDIALFFPGLLGALYGILARGIPILSFPEGAAQMGSSAIFLTMLATLVYCSASSLLGQTPNKIPFISDAVNARMPSIEMFDATGRFIGREQQEQQEKESKTKEDEKDDDKESK